MNKRDILELRRRLKKDSCTISRVAGCYVDINKHKVVTLNENFLNLPDEEFYKYLELAKKTLSGTVGNNILELDFDDEEQAGGKQQFFMGLRSSELKNEDLLDRLYDLIIENYEATSGYLILVYHDSYDIMTRTTDNLKLDESEEVYEYLLVSICPVELSKAGLSYRQEDNRIGARLRDYVVGAPLTGFLFPAFSEGSADIHKVDYFLKDAKDSNQSFIEEVIGCGPKRTATEKRRAFAAVIKQAFPEDKERGEEALLNISESIMDRVAEDSLLGEDAPSVCLTAPVIEEILKENDIPKEEASEIKEVLLEEFADESPEINMLIDEKALTKTLKEKENQALVKEVIDLKSQLKDALRDEAISDKSDFDVVLKVKPQKAELIKTETINGERYILIPFEEEEILKVNGEEKRF